MFINFLLPRLIAIFSLVGIKIVECNQYKQVNSLLIDFDYLVSQLYVQHCSFVEIGEGICSLFVELSLGVGGNRKPLRRQMFFGNCLCSEFRSWQLCSRQLAQQRSEDCVFAEGQESPTSSARVHRRLCDVTGMTQWNPQCNCSVPLAANPQEPTRGFRTCFANPMPASICTPRSVCGTSRCDLSLHGSLYGVKCDKRCKDHQSFCERKGPATSERRNVTSQWSQWSPLSGEDRSNIQQFDAECVGSNNSTAFDCLGPGLLCPEDKDCICEVKVEDGHLKAFRYTVSLEKNMCSDEADQSSVKVRSAGYRSNKDEAKVWNRFLDLASKDDDSNSLFYSPKSNSKKNKPIDSVLLKPESNKIDSNVNQQVEVLNDGKTVVKHPHESNSDLGTRLQVNVSQLSAGRFPERNGNLLNITTIFIETKGNLPRNKTKISEKNKYFNNVHSFIISNHNMTQKSLLQTELLMPSMNEISDYRFSHPTNRYTEETTTVKIAKNKEKSTSNLQDVIPTASSHQQILEEKENVLSNKQYKDNNNSQVANDQGWLTLNFDNKNNEHFTENINQIHFGNDINKAIEGISPTHGNNESNKNKMFNFLDTVDNTYEKNRSHEILQHEVNASLGKDNDLIRFLNKYITELNNSNSILGALQNKILNEDTSKIFTDSLKSTEIPTLSDSNIYLNITNRLMNVNNVDMIKITTSKVGSEHSFPHTEDYRDLNTTRNINKALKGQAKPTKHSSKKIKSKVESGIKNIHTNTLTSDKTLKFDLNATSSEDNRYTYETISNRNYSEITVKLEQATEPATEVAIYISDIENLLPNINPTTNKILRNLTTYSGRSNIAKHKLKLQSNHTTDDPLQRVFSKVSEDITTDGNTAHPPFSVLYVEQSTQSNYDEPEPILKDLDKDTVDYSLADALNTGIGKPYRDRSQYFFRDRNAKINNETLFSSNRSIINETLGD
ncbi:hypothetical protein J6590_046352 [Homalodisca vitripennis]|nr:hypothetical protein J6590_046352 [Homalodisca vitripennis]